MSSLLDLVEQCNNYLSSDETTPVVPFLIQNTTVGLLLPNIIALITTLPNNLLLFRDNQVIFNPRKVLNSREARSAALLEILTAWKAASEPEVVRKCLTGWRNELYPVYGDASDPQNVAFVMERAATPLFGIPTFGSHINGFIRDSTAEGGLRMWIGKRSKTKQTWPGFLDNMVAGGIPFGYSPTETAIKECAEEAGLPAEIARKAIPAGAISYVYRTELGLQPEVQYVYDLELPAHTIPKPEDGEVECFYLWDMKELKLHMLANEFKPNCALVIIDFMIRHGIVTPENEPDYLLLLAGIHRKSDFPGPTVPPKPRCLDQDIVRPSSELEEAAGLVQIARAELVTLQEYANKITLQFTPPDDFQVHGEEGNIRRELEAMKCYVNVLEAKRRIRTSLTILVQCLYYQDNDHIDEESDNIHPIAEEIIPKEEALRRLCCVIKDAKKISGKPFDRHAFADVDSRTTPAEAIEEPTINKTVRVRSQVLRCPSTAHSGRDSTIASPRRIRNENGNVIRRYSGGNECRPAPLSIGQSLSTPSSDQKSDIPDDSTDQPYSASPSNDPLVRTRSSRESVNSSNRTHKRSTSQLESSFRSAPVSSSSPLSSSPSCRLSESFPQKFSSVAETATAPVDIANTHLSSRRRKSSISSLSSVVSLPVRLEAGLDEDFFIPPPRRRTDVQKTDEESDDPISPTNDLPRRGLSFVSHEPASPIPGIFLDSVQVLDALRAEEGVRGSYKTPYTTYLCVGRTRNGTCYRVRKRYSDFIKLRASLVSEISLLPNAKTGASTRSTSSTSLSSLSLGSSVRIPKLPEKRVVGKFDNDFIERRRRGLEAFLSAVAASSHLGGARALREFFREMTDVEQRDEDGRAERVTYGFSMLRPFYGV